MADLKVEDATLASAQATFRTAAGRLGPPVWALKGLSAGVVGAAPLAGRLQDVHGILAAELGTIGQALTELAARTAGIGAALGGTDQVLAARAGELR